MACVKNEISSSFLKSFAVVPSNTIQKGKHKGLPPTVNCSVGAPLVGTLYLFVNSLPDTISCLILLVSVYKTIDDAAIFLFDDIIDSSSLLGKVFAFDDYF